MTTLLLSTWSLPASKALADAAKEAGWKTYVFDKCPALKTRDDLVFYGGTDIALEIASRFHLALFEPSLNLLAKLPMSFLYRTVEYCTFSDLYRLSSPAFIKPADPLNKIFDAGIYANVHDIRTPKAVKPDTPVLVAEPVEWLIEYRCFVLHGKVITSSLYLNFGRPVWQPYSQANADSESSAVLSFCERLFSHPRLSFPPAFVVDVGLIEDRGWAVVEFNPAWCSGVLGADPGRVLRVLKHACKNKNRIRNVDRKWLIER